MYLFSLFFYFNIFRSFFFHYTDDEDEEGENLYEVYIFLSQKNFAPKHNILK